jgi:hypothetical protein
MGLPASLAISIVISAYPQGFQEGDWVNYTNFRFITSAALDQATVYFGTSGGVIRYDRFANRWLEPMTITDGLPAPYIENIAYDPAFDRIYALSRQGPVYYQPTFRQWYSAAEFPFDLARNDFSPGALGVLTTEFGYTYQNGRITDLYFRSYQLTRGVDDGFYRLFVGAWGLGPVVINSRYGDLKLLPYSIHTEDATALIRVDDKFWIGAGLDDADEPGITACDTSMQAFQYFIPRYTTGIGSTSITSALGDGRYTWLGTDYGLVRYDSEAGSFTTYADFSPLPSVEITSLAADTAWIYAGTDRGLGAVARSGRAEPQRKDEKFPNDSGAVKEDNGGVPLSGKNRMTGWRINCLKAIDGYIYVGTERGALRREINNYGDFEFVNTPEGMLSDDILDMAGWGDSLYFGTKNDVIIINTVTGVASTITDQGKFGIWQIRKIAVDSMNVWAATNVGLWKLRKSDGYSRIFTTGDGMISSDVRTIEMLGDHIWMATPRGVIRFYWNRPGRID